MAFDPIKFAQSYQGTTTKNSFDPVGFANQYGGSSASKNKGQSSQDLYNLAVQNGLQGDANRIMATQQGEDTKKIFSGGFISDIFDVLNAMQYGVVGMLKGQGFAKGVETRASFTDKDALGNNGLPGIVAGMALDIAVDPLTWIAPETIIKKVPFLSSALKAGKEFVFGKKVEKVIQETGKTYQAVEGGTQIGKWFADKFVWLNGADPVFKDTYERSIKNIAVGTTNLAQMAKGVAGLGAETAGKLLTKDKTGRFIRRPLEELGKILKPQEYEQVANFYTKLDDLGKQAVDLGLLKKGTFDQNVGEYIKNAYTEYELAKKGGMFNAMKTGIKGIKSRVAGLTPEKMKELGQIDNPAYLLFKSTFDLQKDIENVKLFNAVADKFGSNVIQEGFKQLPEGQRLGSLAGKYVPEQIFNTLQEIVNPAKQNELVKNIVGNFKFAKVVLNPATHARNMISNTILNWWKLGVGPWRADLYAEAAKQALKGGKWVDEAKTVGYGIDTFASNEIKSLLESPEALGFGSKLGNGWKNIQNKLGNIYQGEENIAKLAAFIAQRKKGIGIEEAWKAAESATFNYSQVTPFVRKLRTALFGFPFITFAVKTTPVALETAIKSPGKISVFGKMKTAIENMSDTKQTQAERASEPAYIKDGFYIKLPIKDKHGRSAYFDLTYIIPFGDMISGQFFNRQTNKETGLPESVPSALLGNAPAFNLIKEIAKNQDFYGDSIWRESDSSDKQLKDLFLHISKTYLPPLAGDQLPGGYQKDGTRRQKGILGGITASNQNQQRTLMEEMLRQVGAKIQPIDADIQQTYQDWNTKKALQTLLLEKGVLKNFSTTYQPKK